MSPPSGIPLKRITIVGTLPPLRAISSYCEGLAMALAQRVDIEFFSFRALYPRRLYPADSQEDDTAAPPAAPRLRIRRTLAWYNPLSWICAGMRCQGDLVNLQWWSLPLAPVMLTIATFARLRRVPVVTTIHNIEPHEGGSTAFRVASTLLYALSDKLIVHSNDNARQLQHRYRVAKERIVISPMGIADFRRGRAIDKAGARARLSLAAGNPVLLMFGAIRAYKGLDQVTAALPMVHAQFPNALLLIAGQPWKLDGRNQRLLKTLQNAAGVRCVLRYIPEPEIHDFFAAADVFLLPYTEFHAQSGAGTGALRYGLPIVVAETGSLPELVLDRGSVLPPGNPQMLADRVIEILRCAELRHKLGQDSIKLAKQRSWDSIASTLLNEFADLLH